MVALFVATLAVAGVRVRSVIQSGAKMPTPSAPGSACAPRPCAKVDGLVLAVTGVNRNALLTETSDVRAGYHYVIVQVRLRNEKHAAAVVDPLEFDLRDPTGEEHPLDFRPGSSGCPPWTPVTLGPGSDLPARKICFQAGGPPEGSLTLMWNPVAVKGDVAIPLK